MTRLLANMNFGNMMLQPFHNYFICKWTNDWRQDNDYKNKNLIKNKSKRFSNCRESNWKITLKKTTTSIQKSRLEEYCQILKYHSIFNQRIITNTN